MIPYRPEIDGLRAIAIISVVLFHAWSSTFPGGFVGVDIFFVISGFLITALISKEIEQGHFTFAGFYARRARRILPAFLAMALMTTIAALLLFAPNDLARYGRMVIHTLLFGANFMLATTPGYFHDAAQENPLLHMWSLSVEEQFYAAWPILLILLIRFLPAARRKAAVIGLCAASLIAAEVLVHIWPRTAFFHLPTRGWELLVGAILAMKFVPRIANRAALNVLSMTGVCLMIAPVFLYTKDTAFPGLAALAPVLGAALVIYATEGERIPMTAVLSWKPVVFVGLISYSLYLWHWPIFSFATYALVRPLQASEAFVCVLIGLLLAVISWRYIERPFRRKSTQPLDAVPQPRRFYIPRLAPSGYAALTLTIALVASGTFFLESKGAPWRFSPELRILAEKHFVRLEEVCANKKRERLNLMQCQFGDGSSDVIVWGDSHAQHYLPVLINTYGNGRAYISLACLPVRESEGSGQRPDCQINNRFVLDEIQRLKPRIVVMASYWKNAEKAYPATEGRSDFSRVIQETVKGLTDAGIKVVLMGQVPELKTATYNCVTRSKMFGLAECDLTVPLDEAERAQFNINKTLAELAQTNSSVFLFRPFPYTCDNTRCYAYRDNIMMYYDTNHLTAEGSLALAEPFGKALPQSFH